MKCISFCYWSEFDYVGFNGRNNNGKVKGDTWCVWRRLLVMLLMLIED